MRVVIGEDSALFREGLARLLEDAGHDVVAKAVDAPTLVRAVDRALPDLAIVDVRMPPDRTDDGARAARQLRETYPELGIVLLSGVVGYILKRLNFPMLPLVLGLMLGYMVESNFRRALMVSGDDLGIFVQDKISLLLLIISGIMIFGSAIWPALKKALWRKVAAS